MKNNKIEYLLGKKEYIENKIAYCEEVGRDTSYHENKLAYVNAQLEFHGYEEEIA
jgi:hypothetical protein